MTTKEVPNYPGLLASYDGHLYFDGREVSSWVDHTGYVKTKLNRTPWTAGREGKNRLLHRLVASAWLENPDNLSDINHKNGIKTDNCISNLEWMSRRQNIHHSLRTGLHPNPEKAVVGWNPKTGEGHWFLSQTKAQEFGFTQANLSKCIRGERPVCKGFRWELA